MSSSIEFLDHPRSFSRSPVLIVTAHAFLWGIWLLGLFAFAPRYESMYRKFNLLLPKMSEFMFTLTHGPIPAALLLVPIFVALDSVVYYRMRRSVAEKMWSGLMTAVPVMAILMTCFAICAPALKLVEGMAK
jgi:type II secretory pathway component PulF